MPMDVLEKKKSWLEKLKREGKLRDPTEDHRIGIFTLQNKVRREIIKFLADGKKSFEEIMEKFKLSDFQTKMHLQILEQALFIECFKEEDRKYYALTPRGEAYLENVEWR